MKDISLKLRLILVPFLLVSIGTIICYSLLHLAYILAGLDLVNEEVVQFFIPMAAPIIPIYIWLYPRFKLLKPRKDKDPAWGCSVIAWMAIMAPMIVAQVYIDDASGSLTPAGNVAQIDSLPKSKYYALSNFIIDKNYAGIHDEWKVTGKYNNNLDFEIYIAMPLLDAERDTSAAVHPVWLGHTYYETVNNSGTPAEKEKKFDDFWKSSIEDFNQRDFKQFTYLKRLAKSDKRNGLLKAIERVHPGHPKDIAILIAEEDAFEYRTGSTFQWIFGVFAIGSIIFLLVGVIFQNVDEDKLALYSEGMPIETEKDKDEPSGISLLIPKKDFFITPILIDINLAIYLAMVICGLGFISFSGKDLLRWGADYTPLVNQGQYWRLFTSMFLHGGLMHIVGNMFGLLFAGVFLEPVLGRVKYLLAYILTGLISSCASIWWHPATVSIGASGAIFGLFGVFLALLLTGIFPDKAKKQMLTTVAIFIGYNLLMGLSGGIDNAAHLGGLASGVVLGFALSFTIDKKKELSQLAESMEGSS
jgi:rhomboid protease GluP